MKAALLGIWFYGFPVIHQTCYYPTAQRPHHTKFMNFETASRLLFSLESLHFSVKKLGGLSPPELLSLLSSTDEVLPTASTLSRAEMTRCRCITTQYPRQNLNTKHVFKHQTDFVGISNRPKGQTNADQQLSREHDI